MSELGRCRVLLAANFGRNKNDEAKQRKVAVEYVRLCGYGNGGYRKAQCQNGTVLTLDEIAAQLDTVTDKGLVYISRTDNCNIDDRS